MNWNKTMIGRQSFSWLLLCFGRSPQSKFALLNFTDTRPFPRKSISCGISENEMHIVNNSEINFHK